MNERIVYELRRGPNTECVGAVEYERPRDEEKTVLAWRHLIAPMFAGTEDEFRHAAIRAVNLPWPPVAEQPVTTTQTIAFDGSSIWFNGRKVNLRAR